MSLIYSRSPFFIQSTSTTSTTVSLYVWNGNSSSVPASPQYTLTKAGNSLGNATFEVSELIRDYVDQSFNGDYVTEAVWVYISMAVTSGGGGGTVTSDKYLATDGYIDEDFVQYWSSNSNNNLKNDRLLISNERITTADDTVVTIPVNGDASATFFKDGEIKYIDSVTETTNSTEVVQYLSSAGQSAATFYARVIQDGGTVIDEDCADEIMEYVTELDVDEVILGFNNGTNAYLDIETAPCNKYENSRLVFVNKFGALQHIDFSAKNTESMSSKGSSYNSINFDYDNLSNNYGSHSVRDFNKNATVRHTLNTDYLHESYSEVFRQLIVSEEVWMEHKGTVKPVNVTTNSLQKKTHANNGLVQFTISVKESHSLINNIR